MAPSRSGRLGDVLAGLSARRAHPYAGADRRNAARILALAWLVTGLITLAYLPFAEPTDAIGDLGWVAAAAIVLASFACAWRLLSAGAPSFDLLLLLCYLGLAQVAALEWLTGSPGAPYQELFLIWLGAGVGIHPPLRGLAFLAATIAVALAPLLYASADNEVISEVASELPLWAALAVLIMALMTFVRAQRVTLQSAEREARDLARADELTRLGNRRAYQEALASEIGRTRRADSPLSVALVDIDRFKEVNDRFGHLEGDGCLRQTAEALREGLRAGDRAFRWGGDEFALLLPDTDFGGAAHALERVAERVARTCRRPDGERLTVAWGVAELVDDMDESELLARADIALLERKRQAPELAAKALEH